MCCILIHEVLHSIINHITLHLALHSLPRSLQEVTSILLKHGLVHKDVSHTHTSLYKLMTCLLAILVFVEFSRTFNCFNVWPFLRLFRNFSYLYEAIMFRLARTARLASRLAYYNMRCFSDAPGKVTVILRNDD